MVLPRALPPPPPSCPCRDELAARGARYAELAQRGVALCFHAPAPPSRDDLLLHQPLLVRQFFALQSHVVQSQGLPPPPLWPPRNRDPAGHAPRRGNPAVRVRFCPLGGASGMRSSLHFPLLLLRVPPLPPSHPLPSPLQLEFSTLQVGNAEQEAPREAVATLNSNLTASATHARHALLCSTRRAKPKKTLKQQHRRHH